MSFTISGSIITQSGTDANPSGLGAIAGVTTISDSNGQVLTYDIANLRLNVTGSMTIPDKYWIKAQSTSSGTSLNVTSTGTLIIDGRTTITRAGVSLTLNSMACGIIVRKPSGLPYVTSTILFDSGSQFEQYGGVIETSGAIRWTGSTTSIATIKDAIWYILDRNANGYMNIYFDLSKINIDGLTVNSNGTANIGLLRNLDAGYSVKGYKVIGGLTGISAIDGSTALIPLSNFVGGLSKTDFSIRNGGTVTSEIPVGGYDFYDANIGNSLIAATNGTNGESRGRARHYVSYGPTFLSAANASAINGGTLYLKDTNSGSRQTTNGVATDKIYISQTSAAGVISTISLLTKVWSGIGVNPFVQDDRLPISGYLWAYGQTGLPVNIVSSIGPQTPTLYAPADVNVTLSEAAAGALAAIATLDDLYDAAKYWKTRATQSQLEYPSISTQPVIASGTTIDLGSRNLVIDGTAASAFAINTSTNTITIKSTALAAGSKFNYLRTTGTVTFSNGGGITTNYIDAAGAVVSLSQDGGGVFSGMVRINGVDSAAYHNVASIPMTVVPTSTVRIYMIAYGRKGRIINTTGADLLQNARFALDVDADIDLGVNTTKRNEVSAALDYVSDGQGNIGASVNANLVTYTPAEALAGFHWWLVSEGTIGFTASLAANSASLFETGRGSITLGSSNLYVQASDSFTVAGVPASGIYVPLVITSSVAGYNPIRKNVNGVVLGTALWSQDTASISASDKAGVATAVLDSQVETGATLAQSLRLSNSVLGGKVSGAGSGVEKFRNLSDTKDRIVSTVDSDGNRKTVVSDLT